MVNTKSSTDKIDNNYILSMTIKNDNAPSDGKTPNAVSIVCIDSIDFSPAKGLNVIFTVISNSGTAFFSESQSTIYQTITDGIGIANANILDTVAEDVVIRCHVASDQASQITKTITFRQLTEKFSITSATNLNHTFLSGEPTVAWAGAEFVIHTTGGSRNIEWKINNIVQELSIIGNTDGSATVLIKEDPRRPIDVIAEDKLTGETDRYTFYLQDFVRSNRQKYSFEDAEDNFGNYLLPVITYERLYSQWGNLASYFIWSTAVDETYWTSERADYINIEIPAHTDETIADDDITKVKKYFVFDVKTGTKTISSTSSKYKKYFMYKLL